MYGVFSLMCTDSMQNNWSKSKHLHKINSHFNSRKIGWNTFMAAVLFFWNFNMVAAKSCPNLYLKACAYLIVVVVGKPPTENVKNYG